METYRIVQRGQKWIVQTEDGGRNLGEHDTKEDAEKQLAAVEASKDKQQLGVIGSAAHSPGPINEERMSRIRAFVGSAEFASASPADSWDQVGKFGVFKKRDVFGIQRESDFNLEHLGESLDCFSSEVNPGWADFNHDFGEACAYYDAACMVVDGIPARMVTKQWAPGVVTPGADQLKNPLVGAVTDGLYWHRFAITDRGKSLLPNVRFTSPAFDCDGEDEEGKPVGFSIFNIAWCSGPHLDGMKPLEMSRAPRVTFKKFSKSPEGVSMPEDKLKRYGVDDKADAPGLKAAMSKYADEVDAKMAKYDGDLALHRKMTEGMDEQSMARFKKFAEEPERLKRFRSNFSDDDGYKKFSELFDVDPSNKEQNAAIHLKTGNVHDVATRTAEREAMTKFTTALGLGEDAKPSEMLRTFTAKYIGMDKHAEMQAQIAALQKRDVEMSKASVKSAAEQFADAAIGKFRQTKDKRDLVIEAYTDAADKLATGTAEDKAKAGAAAAERQLFPENTFSALKTFTANGGPLGVEHPQTQFNASGMATAGGEFDAAVKAHMAKNPTQNYSQAMDAVHKAQPGLYGR